MRLYPRNASEARIDEAATKTALTELVEDKEVKPADLSDEDKDSATAFLPPRVDIQAALTILGRRERRTPGRLDMEIAADYKLDLRSCHLARADLNAAILGPALLDHTNLQEAQLIGANLQKAQLFEANLQEAQLDKANLHKADINQARTSLALVKSASLRGAVNLTAKQVKSMFGDDSTE